MARLSYETADTLIYDPIAAHRNATRTVLYTLGFSRIETCASVGEFNQAIKRRSPDLALCEAQGADAELCEMIQTLRQGAGGHINPFLVIMVTAWEKKLSLVNRVLNSGADDLLLRPFTADLLSARIDGHVERRKQFVITHDYVGPDRRRDPARASPREPFNPPNSLKMKAKEGLSGPAAVERLQKELDVAKDTLSSEKLRRDAFQICVLWRLLQDKAEAASPANLDKLRALTNAVAGRCRGTELEQVLPWCDSVLAGVEGLNFGVDRNASMHLLGHAALNLVHTLSPETTKMDLLRSVADVASAIQTRAVSTEKVSD